MEEDVKRTAYVAFRWLEGICISVFIFGFLWNGTEMLNLTMPQFMMLYGGVGAIVSEGLARLINRQIKKNITKEETKSG